MNIHKEVIRIVKEHGHFVGSFTIENSRYKVYQLGDYWVTFTETNQEVVAVLNVMTGLPIYQNAKVILGKMIMGIPIEVSELARSDIKILEKILSELKHLVNEVS